MAKLYYRIDNPSDVREMEEFYNALLAEGNPKADDWAALPPRPGDDYVWQNGQWIQIQQPTEEI